MVKLTKEDENKLGQILKELNEMKNVLKGGEGSGIRGHKTQEKLEGVPKSELMTGKPKPKQVSGISNSESNREWRRYLKIGKK